MPFDRLIDRRTLACDMPDMVSSLRAFSEEASDYGFLLVLERGPAWIAEATPSLGESTARAKRICAACLVKQA
jgi:hypothetical protein